MSRRNLPRAVYTDGDVRGKKIWSTEEDHLLRDLVLQHGTGNWPLLATSLAPRTGKQCRERWFNHLDDDVKKGNWTEEEDNIILTMQKIHGNQWAKIVRFLISDFTTVNFDSYYFVCVDAEVTRPYRQCRQEQVAWLDKIR
jgi:hypothetical protein